MTSHVHRQRGAALIIVLLLAATLSFLVLALVSATTQSVRRSGGAAIRGELLWRASSAEIIAKAAIAEAFRVSGQGGPALTRAHPLFAQQLGIPFTNGAGAIIFADASRCFNVNSLRDSTEEAGAAAEFAAMLIATGMSDADARSLAGVVKDWVDEDAIQEIGGAEDGFYASLPTPYRTGGALVASVSELRAMKGVTGAIYGAVSPYLCALPTSDAAIVNINALRPQDAPLLTAITSGVVDPVAAADLIEDRPPGGWTNVDQFLALPVFQDEDFDSQGLSARISVTPQYIEAVAGATVNEIDMSVRLLFATNESGDVRLISRILGDGA